MAISGDIEKLERRWVENPTGLMFAPLAEAYRKAGDSSRALEILEQGLGQHPDYVPALIVRGRCQLDGEGYPEAQAAFQQALDRDPVNPIALRGLAEVFERTGRNGMAIERLEVLLEVDRGDTEARADLARLRELPAVSSPSSNATPSGQMPDVEPEAHGTAIADEPNLPPAKAPEVPEVPSPAMQWAEWMPGRLNVDSGDATPEPEELETLVGFVTNDSDGPMADLLTEDEPVAGDETETEDADVAEVAAEPVAEVSDPEPPASKWSSWASWRDSRPDATTAETAEDAEEESSADAPIGWAPRPTEAETVEVAASDAEADAPAGSSGPVEVEAEADLVEVEAEVEVEVEAEAEAEAEVVADADLELEGEFEAEAVIAAAVEVAEPEPVEPEAEEDAEEEAFEAAAVAEDGLDIEAESELVAEAEAERSVTSVAEDDDEEPVAIEELVMTQELIVTESMAELFLRQGHRDLALAVYRQLVATSGYDHLHDTIADLERTAGVSRDPAPMATPAAPEPSQAMPAAKPARRGAAADTGGVSVATFLREVLDAPPPASDSAVLPPAIERGPAGEPTRDAGQALSLSDVFGEESASAAHPAIPAEERRPSPESETPVAAEPSYDEFFGAVGAEEDMPGATVGSESEHLEQFNEWLRGLKR